MIDDVALAAFLGHLDVVQRTFELTDAQTVALLERAVKARSTANSESTTPPTVDASPTPSEIPGPEFSAGNLDNAFDDGFDDDFDATDPHLNEIDVEGQPPLDPMGRTALFASAESSNDVSSVAESASSRSTGADVASSVAESPPLSPVADVASSVAESPPLSPVAEPEAAARSDVIIPDAPASLVTAAHDVTPPLASEPRAPEPPASEPAASEPAASDPWPNESTAPQRPGPPRVLGGDLDDIITPSPFESDEGAVPPVAAPALDPLAPPPLFDDPGAASFGTDNPLTMPSTAPLTSGDESNVPTAGDALADFSSWSDSSEAPAPPPLDMFADGEPMAPLPLTPSTAPSDIAAPESLTLTPVSDRVADDEANRAAAAAAAAALTEADVLDGLLPAEVTIPDAPPLNDQSAPPSQALRSVPRFRNRTEVDVHLDGRGDLQKLWTKDISKGGLFVTTQDPPPSGTIVTVQLQTPDGGLLLKSEVVHVLDAITANAAGIDPGVGLQFVDLDNVRREALERYVDGIAARLEDGSTSGPSAAATADRLQVARAFLRKVDDGLLYQALGIAPETEDHLVRVTIDALRLSLTSEMAGLNESDRGRLERAGRVLERISKVLLEPFRRLDYDFRQDIVRAPERIEAATKSGDDLVTTRSAWERVWPDRVKAATELVMKAVDLIKREGDFFGASEIGRQALALDPFNLELINAHRSWEIVVSLPGAFAAETIDGEAWVVTAQSHQIDLAVLRSVWQHVQPQKILDAGEIAQKAMAAENVHAFDQAVARGLEALALDPFNAQLRAAIAEWRQKASAPTSG